MAQCVVLGCPHQASIKRLVYLCGRQMFVDVCYEHRKYILQPPKENPMDKIIEELLNMANEKLKEAEILAAGRDYIQANNAAVESRCFGAVAAMLKNRVFN